MAETSGRARGKAEAKDTEPEQPEVVGTPTNHAMTRAEVLSQIDDGAVRPDGRLANTVYLDDIQAEEEQRRREKVESGPEASDAAAKLRELAGKTGQGRPAEDLARTSTVEPPRPSTGPATDKVLPDDRQKTQLGAGE